MDLMIYLIFLKFNLKCNILSSDIIKIKYLINFFIIYFGYFLLNENLSYYFGDLRKFVIKKMN